ncbi:MAG: hypothetical protein P1U85_05645 [Verrucomicrobiales bacterium]|jgi:hypothetical protein|nr:hypothetical protein [Verrucomicrobiales bacterium]
MGIPFIWRSRFIPGFRLPFDGNGDEKGKLAQLGFRLEPVMAQQRYDESKRRERPRKDSGRKGSFSVFPGSHSKPKRLVFPDPKPMAEKEA